MIALTFRQMCALRNKYGSMQGGCGPSVKGMLVLTPSRSQWLPAPSLSLSLSLSLSSSSDCLHRPSDRQSIAFDRVLNLSRSNAPTLCEEDCTREKCPVVQATTDPEGLTRCPLTRISIMGEAVWQASNDSNHSCHFLTYMGSLPTNRRVPAVRRRPACRETKDVRNFFPAPGGRCHQCCSSGKFTAQHEGASARASHLPGTNLRGCLLACGR